MRSRTCSDAISRQATNCSMDSLAGLTDGMVATVEPPSSGKARSSLMPSTDCRTAAARPVWEFGEGGRGSWLSPSPTTPPGQPLDQPLFPQVVHTLVQGVLGEPQHRPLRRLGVVVDARPAPLRADQAVETPTRRGRPRTGSRRRPLLVSRPDTAPDLPAGPGRSARTSGHPRPGPGGAVHAGLRRTSLTWQLYSTGDPGSGAGRTFRRVSSMAGSDKTAACREPRLRISEPRGIRGGGRHR